MSLALTSSTSLRSGVQLGSTEPRLWTPPLRPLTPETSVGFDQIEFARDVLRRPFDPWQEFAVIHAGELLEDGSPRFRIVLLLVARQQGKTEILAILPVYWMAVDEAPMVLGLSTKVEYAKESWMKTRKLIENAPALQKYCRQRWYVEGNNRIEMWLSDARYKIAASNSEGGRSLTVRNLMFDEFRHTTMASWEAAEPATSSVADAQIWCTSNAGSDDSLLLNEMREAAIRFIETGVGDSSVCLLEWSAPEDADPTDLASLGQANPNLGRRTRADRLQAKARAAVAAGGESLNAFKTNYLCQRVRVNNPAIDPGAWSRCLDPGTLDDLRSRVAVCLDVSPDSQHVSLVAAAVMLDGRVRVEGIASWEGIGATNKAARALPALLAKVKPKAFGWLPNGPAAAMAATLADRRKQGRFGWPPAGVNVAEIRGEVAGACMGLADLVTAEQICHSGEPLLDDHVGAAEKLKRGDVWVFSRKGDGYVDAAYATAGAVQLARTLPTSDGKPRLFVVEEE